MSDIIEPDIIEPELPPAYQFLSKPARYKVVYGGRGKAATWTFATLLILMAAEKQLRILCTREIQRSIKNSVQKVLIDTIGRLGMKQSFDILKDSIVHKVTGSEFLFMGLHRNREEVRGTEGIDICWLGEARNVSQDSLDFLIPTIRKENSEIWVDFNPDQETDPIYDMMVTNGREGALVKKLTYRDNPWFPEVLRKEMEWDREHDTDKYQWIWEGNTRTVSEALVFKGVFVERPFTIEEFGEPDGGPYYGADWGFSVDPTTLIRCFIKGQVLYIDYEAYGLHIDLDAMPALFDQVPHSRDNMITADSARPEMIHEMNKRGFFCDSARKGKGSIEDGIAHIRSYKEVVIHPRCRHTLEEFKLYSYKTDPLTGNPIPKLEDKHNHIIDALRYSLEDVSRGFPTVAFI